MSHDADPRPRRHFHQELDSLQDLLLEMAGIVEEQLRLACAAVDERDAGSASAVMRADDRVDELEIGVDERVMELLALHQPMAKDLRQVIATLKVANDLERVGDHAVNMAKAARRLAQVQALPEVPEIPEMAGITRGMLSDALASFVSRNPGTARMVCVRDDKVDNLRRSLFRILVTHMMEEPRRITPALELLLVSQNLERIADLSTNIAEDVVFLVEGRTIKHHAETRDSGGEDDEEG